MLLLFLFLLRAVRAKDLKEKVKDENKIKQKIIKKMKHKKMQ